MLVKDYLQPAATLLVAIGIGFVAIEQHKNTAALINYSHKIGAQNANAKDIVEQQAQLVLISGFKRNTKVTFLMPTMQGCIAAGKKWREKSGYRAGFRKFECFKMH